MTSNDSTSSPSNSNNLKLLNEFRECITVLVLLVVARSRSTTLNIGHYDVLDHYEALYSAQRKPTLALNALATMFVRNEAVVAVGAVGPAPYDSVYRVITHALEVRGDLPEECEYSEKFLEARPTVPVSSAITPFTALTNSSKEFSSSPYYIRIEQPPTEVKDFKFKDDHHMWGHLLE